MSRISKRAWAFTAAGVGVAAVAATVGFNAATYEPDPDELPLTNASAAYRRPGQTAQDWVTYADHVILARAVDEEVHEPLPVEAERGEGMVGRTVTLEVERVLWSASDPAQPAPKTYEYPTWGFVFTGGVDNMRPVGTQDEPRVEVGHDYVIAIDWEEARCSQGDEPQPAMWMGLDNSSVVPADDGVVGSGESGGRVASAQVRRSSSEPVLRGEGTFEGRMMGETVASLARELAQAEPHANPRSYDQMPQVSAPTPDGEVHDEALPEGVTPQELAEAEPEDTSCPE
ncbi:hypothetical protein HNR06_004950 [Nocardiopsis arvandica]|uniref:Uncharacterized protein n=1 Tax=Nocardiopsis sinuspersici TaxID=501010 RepID=A0A7Y9XGF1_9ACTN|nr:hypothetical protein [Nocardiopsis sinuspersici]NYH55361.1 hypothetical protein [Nocardiopsis sinuspersici]